MFFRVRGIVRVQALEARLLRAAVIGALLLSAAPAWPQIGRKMPDEGQEHIRVGAPGTYRHHPPTPGPHWPLVAAWGAFDREMPPELWVHNLKHGGIVILYRCDAPCPELVGQLQEVYRSFPKSKHGHVKLIVAPYRKLRTRLAILAWTWIDEMEAFDRQRLLQFYRAHVDRGPEDAP